MPKLGSLPLRQIGKRARVDLQPLELACHLTLDKWHEAIPYLSGIKEPLALIADYQRIKRARKPISTKDLTAFASIRF
jgi:hypothetical protein